MVESAGLGVSVGAVIVGVIAIAMLATDGTYEMLPIAAGAVGLGAIAGGVRGVATKPSVAAVARQADAQLKLADLLATALAFRDDRDPWARLVVARADRQAITIGANDVILHRLGARAWGGIGLVTATAVVLAAFGTDPDRATAGPTKRNQGGQAVVAHIENATGPTIANVAAGAGRQAVRPGVSNDATQMPQADPAGLDAANRPMAGKRAADGAGGTGAAQTPTNPRDDRATYDFASAAPSSETRTGERRSGDGTESLDATSGNDATADGRAAANRDGATAGLRMNNRSRSPIDVTGAASRVNLQAVPDAYRDVTRAYFEERP